MMSEAIGTQKLIFQYPEIPKLISIIICVYNSASYLQQMLDSIYAQTYRNFEVIVAYDTKSTDKSLGILKQYAEKYGLIIDLDNDSSIGYSRVRGARLARGEYLIYLDSDDLIVPTYLDDLLGCFVQYPEINASYCGYRFIPESGLEDAYRTSINSVNKYSILDTEQSLSYFQNWSNSHFLINGSCWVWLVRRSFLQDIGCYFPDISRGEDVIYVFQLLLNSEQIGHSSRYGYLYVKHPRSVCHKKKTSAQQLSELNDMYKYVTPLLTSSGYAEFALQKKKEDYLSFLRTLPYSEYKEGIEKEGIDHLQAKGNFSSKLSILCFNMSKWVYWAIHQIMGKKNLQFE